MLDFFAKFRQISRILANFAENISAKFRRNSSIFEIFRPFSQNFGQIGGKILFFGGEICDFFANFREYSVDFGVYMFVCVLKPRDPPSDTKTQVLSTAVYSAQSASFKTTQTLNKIENDILDDT